MRFFKIHHPIESDDPHLIEEYYRERFYGGVTILALVITFLFSGESFTSTTVFSTILLTTLGLWLAGVFASVVSARIVHKSQKMQDQRIRKTLIAHRGILKSGVVPLIFVGLSIFIDILDLKTALVLVLLISFLRASFTVIDAFIKSDRHFLLNTISFILQILAIGVIIFLKVASEK
ncbi:hypothetical protein N9J72_01095 [Candidatus Gracilibacteria bacterium]|nr:hypothetical protein [Candidatus Gracilibacteria bacterium]